jgi:hypothetical protein
VLRISEVFVKGITNKMIKAPPIAATPPSLSGIERKMA